ncbi:MAG: hypothetical protein R2702_09440 [Acidimicrobiales bacterium]
MGVTGHRSLADPAGVRASVDAVLDRLDPPLTAVSSLAEGADRLVARAVLDRPAGRLVALLPLEPAEYAADFGDGASVEEFNELLDAADEVRVIAPPPDDDGSREAAYERAGLAVLEGADVLVALWDGGPGRGRGGTADLVAEARRRGRPVEVVDVERAP